MTASTGATGPTGPTGLLLSSYVEAVGSAQAVGTGQNLVFDVDPDSLDVVGNDISLDATGTVFTITRAGLYHVEWSMHVDAAAQPALVCMLEDMIPSSAMSISGAGGNCSSGALINVLEDDLPFTLSLHNYAEPISVVDALNFEGTAVSIRILRFADGPDV